MSYVIYDYRCECCGVTAERLETRPAPTHVDCGECGAAAQRLPPCPKMGTVWGYAAHRGRNEEPPPGSFSTEALADGMPLSAWKKQRREKRRQESVRELHGRFGTTPRQWSYS